SPAWHEREGGRQRDESLISDGRKSKGQNLSRRRYNVPYVPHRLRVSHWRRPSAKSGARRRRQIDGREAYMDTMNVCCVPSGKDWVSWRQA
ncbi:hypothetical protein CH063_08324, partial [Colletotrichum higginsianum]